MKIPKKVIERTKSLKTFRKVLAEARNADRSEQDTVTIVTDMLAEVFGFDKYSEITGEYAIRGTFCDIAVKTDGKVRYLIEVKAVGKTLRDNHLRQATDYAAKEGIEWVVLTNGVEWQAHRMIFEQPVRYDHVFTLDVIESKSDDLQEMVFMLSREGITKNTIEEYHEQRQILNRHFISAAILSETVVNAVRRELKRISPNVKVEASDLLEEIKSNVIKRDIIEGEEIKDALRKLNRAAKKQAAAKSKAKAEVKAAEPKLPQDSSQGTNAEKV